MPRRRGAKIVPLGRDLARKVCEVGRDREVLGRSRHRRNLQAEMTPVSAVQHAT